MLGIFFDIIVLGIAMFIVDREEASDLLNLLIAVVLMTVANMCIAMALAASIGLLILVPILVVDGIIIRWRFTLTWNKTIAAMAIYICAKVVFILALAKMVAG